MKIKKVAVNEKSKAKNWGREIQYIIIMFIVIAILIPILLEYLIFRNNVVSVLTNGEWSSFLGSFLGGIIGGIGTLTAVFITTKETRKIQEDTNNNLEVDRKMRRMSEKKELANQITVLIGEYIADISAYFYANRSLERLDDEKGEIIRKIDEVDSKLIEAHAGIENCPESSDFIISISGTIEKLNVEKAGLVMKKGDKEKEIENTRKDRLIANKCFFTIKIILKDVNCASELIDQLNVVHTLAASAYNQKLESIEIETNKLIHLTATFSNDYTAE